MLRLERRPLTQSQLVLGNVGLALAYFGTAKIGQLLAMPGSSITVIWPPSGMALAALFVFGRGLSPGVWLGAWAANLAGLLHQTHPPEWLTMTGSAAVMATGALGAALFGMWFLEKITTGPRSLRRVTQVALMLAGGEVSSLLSATVGTLTLGTTGLIPWSEFGGVWFTWWLGDSMGILLFTPLLLSWWQREGKFTRGRRWEAIACFSLLSAASWWAFLLPTPRFVGETMEDFIVLPFLTWAALRLGYRATTTAMVSLATIAVVGAIHGNNLNGPTLSHHVLVVLAGGLACVVPSVLCLTAVVQERWDAETSLQAANQNLETQVARRTQSLKNLAEQLQNEFNQERLMAEELSRLAAIVQSSRDAIISKSVEGRITSWNPGAERTFGYTAAEMLGRPISTLTTPERAADEANIFAAACRGQTVAPFESERLHKNGTVLRVAITLFPIRNGAGTVIGGAIIARDVTAQKAAELALQESTERLHLAVEVARMGTWDLDLATYDVHANTRHVKMFGGPTAQDLIHGADFKKFIHPDDLPPLRAALQQAIARSNQLHERFRVVWPNHAIHWLEIQASVFRNLAGRAIRMVGVTVDVTERHEAEESLRRSEQQYAVLVNNIDGIVWEADVRSHRMTFVSHQTNQILGYPASDWITNATFWQDHMHPEDRAAALKYCAARTKRGEDYNFEYRMIAADGREIWVEDFVTVVMEQNEPVTLRGVMVDITRRKQLEQEQARAYSLLQTTIESSEDGLLVVDRGGRVRVHNQRFAQMWQLPASLLAAQDDQALLDFVLPQLIEPDLFRDGVKYLYEHPQRESFDVLQFKDGRTFERYSRPQRLEQQIIGRVWSFRDVTERRSNERLMQGQARILEGIASGVTLPKTLTELCHTAEAASPGLCCAILLLDEAGQKLRHEVSPSLPEDYCRQVDGSAIGPKACSYGTAVYREATVITEDITTDPLWENDKTAVLALGLRACWAMPLFDPKRAVIGVLVFYYPTPKRPTARERRIIEMATNTATIAILEHRADEQLARSAKILRQLSANLLEAQEVERRHLARELHDELGQTLTATKITLESVQHDLTAAAAPAESPPAGSLALRTAISHVETMLQQVRNLSLSLRPPILDDCGLPAALRWLTDQHTKTTGRPVTFDLKHYEGHLEPALQTACFRIAQEALTNVTRHAQARKVNVELQCDLEHLTLVVRDDGIGFNVNAAITRAHAGGSVGLLGQQERAALLGGRVDIISRPGAGSEIRVWFPLQPDKNTA